MPKSDYIHPNDAAFSGQLITFKNIIGDYSAVLTSVAPALITGQAADADYFADCLQRQDITGNLARQETSWKDLIRRGGTPPASGAPAAPKFPPGPPAVEPGIEPRFRALAQMIKADPNYNPGMGEALGIVGADQAGPDYAILKPVITAVINGGRVDVGWNWGGYRDFLSMCEIQVDRDDSGTFVLLATDTTPGYVDTEPFPQKPAKWTYRAIYHAGDNRVGLWSDPVSVNVGG